MPGSVFPELVSCHGDNGHSLGLICSCLPEKEKSKKVELRPTVPLRLCVPPLEGGMGKGLTSTTSLLQSGAF